MLAGTIDIKDGRQTFNKKNLNLARHCGPVGQYSPVDSEVGGSNHGNGKPMFYMATHYRLLIIETNQQLISWHCKSENWLLAFEHILT